MSAPAYNFASDLLSRAIDSPISERALVAAGHGRGIATWHPYECGDREILATIIESNQVLA